MGISRKKNVKGSKVATTRRDVHGNPDDASFAILKAWRFLEDVADQVEALRREVKRQVEQAAGLKDLRIRVESGDADYTDDNEEWVVRSVIDTFQLYDRRKRGAPSPVIFAAFQVSLAPSRAEADGAFYPNLAVLVAGQKKGDSKWGQWECEEFELDNECMTLPGYQENDNAPWWKMDKDHQHRWYAASEGDPAVAFVVPLVELKNEEDVKTKVIEPFVREVDSMLKGLSKAT